MSKVQGFVQTKRRTGSSFAAHTLIKIAWIQARVGSHLRQARPPKKQGSF